MEGVSLTSIVLCGGQRGNEAVHVLFRVAPVRTSASRARAEIGPGQRDLTTLFFNFFRLIEHLDIS